MGDSMVVTVEIWSSDRLLGSNPIGGSICVDRTVIMSVGLYTICFIHITHKALITGDSNALFLIVQKYDHNSCSSAL